MYTLCQLKAWHSSVLTSSVGICSQPSPQLCASLWASWTTILQPMRMRFLICLLVSSFLLYSKKNTVQPQYEWSTTVTGVVQALKIFLDVLSMKTWHFFLLSPPDVAPSCYTDGMETLLPKEPARTICSQANPTKPVGLWVRGLWSYCWLRYNCQAFLCFQKTMGWVDTKTSLTQELSYQVGWIHSTRIT